jgi:hypothetical protein
LRYRHFARRATVVDSFQKSTIVAQQQQQLIIITRIYVYVQEKHTVIVDIERLALVAIVDIV